MRNSMPNILTFKYEWFQILLSNLHVIYVSSNWAIDNWQFFCSVAAQTLIFIMDVLKGMNSYIGKTDKS